MRISISAAVLLFIGVASRSSGFHLYTPVGGGRTFLSSSVLRSKSDIHEFDQFLGERTVKEQIEFQQQQQFQRQTPSNSRRRFLVPDEQGTVLVSSTALEAPGTEESALESDESSSEYYSSTSIDEMDPYADMLEESSSSTMNYQQEQQQPQSFTQGIENKLKGMDLFDITSTLIIPSIVTFAGVRWGVNRVSSRIAGKTDETLDAFASEMIYHDSDFEEMKMCFNDYSKKLVWLGPRKTPLMLKRYLQLYSKKKTVSPQSISSLSYVFSLFQLKEEAAAQILVSLCRDLGEEKISSAGKLLFFGSRIMKTPSGKAALLPIKDMIKATYREASVADEMVDMSQKAMAEAAYKSAVIAAGKNQDSLTIGWEVLGLDKETATRIFEEEAKDGFVSDREKMYGGQSTKYDKHGNAIDDDGNLLDPDNKVEGTGDSDDDIPASGAMECSDCGYTLFIAKGRESKFFGDGFKCPNCGAKKDKFKPKIIEE